MSYVGVKSSWGCCRGFLPRRAGGGFGETADMDAEGDADVDTESGFGLLTVELLHFST